MDQQLKFSILNNVIGSDKLDNFKSKLDKVAKGLTATAAASYLFEKGQQALSSGLEKLQNSIDYGDQLQALSEKTGINTQALSGYQSAAEQANLSIGGLEVGLRKFSQQLGDPNADKFKDTLTALGVSAIDPTTKKIKESSIIIDQLADKFEKMENGPKKAALAISLFGKSGTDMIPFLNMGSEELRKYGLSFSESFTINSDKFNDNMTLIRNGFKQKLIDVLDEALPKLIALQELIININSGSNKKGMGDQLADGLVKLADYLHFAGQLFTDLFDKVSVVAGYIKDSFLFLAEVVVKTFSSISTAFMDAMTGNFNGLKVLTAELSKSSDEYVKKSGAGILAITRQQERQKSIDNFSKAADDIVSGKSISAVVAKKKSTTDSNPPDDRTKKEDEAIKKFLITQNEQIQQQRDKLDAYKYSSAEIQKHTIALQLNSQVEKESIGWTQKSKEEFKSKAQEIIAQKQALVDSQEAQKASFSIGAQEAFKDYLEKIKDVAQQTKNLFTTAFNGIEDALVSFVRKGKLDFTDFANAVLDQMARIAVQQATLGILSTVGLSAVGSASSAGATGSYLGANTAFANGGIMTSQGSVPLRKYATGGIASSPQVALFGEGARPEAFIPLPDGRSVPVSLKGGGSNVNIVLNISNNSSDQVTGEKGADTQAASLLAAKVKEVIINEMRPGGLLNG